MKIRIRTVEDFWYSAENECHTPMTVLRRCSEMVGGETFSEVQSEGGKTIVINTREIVDVREVDNAKT